MMSVADQTLFEIVPGNCFGQSSSIDILMLQAANEGMTVSTVNHGETQMHAFAPGWLGLLVLDRIGCTVVSGRAVACKADAAALAKLQAFLDAGRANADAAGQVVDHGAQLIANIFPPTLDIRDRRAVESWFLMQASNLAADTDFTYVGAALRATEHYKLVQFLLSQPATRSMRDLSARYGLSYSHFRRLCREALGRGGKAEFQQWRNVRALLDMVDRGGSLTDVALRQGFASSSHFSDAMKGQFGISPRYLTRALSKEKS